LLEVRVTMPTTTYAGLSDVGRKRTRNDDRWGADPALGLYIVADGVGSTSHGDLAAALVVDTLPGHVARHLQGVDLHDPQATARLGTAVVDMCNELYGRSKNEEDLGSADTTLVSAVIVDSRALIAHLGDSRAYLYRGGQVHRLTSDHTIVQAVVDAGELTPEAAAVHPNRSVVTRHVLMTPPAKPDVSVLDLQPGDRILLCSDGLHGVIDDATLAAILNDYPDPADACRVLIDAANRGGGPDNITAVVVNAGQGPATSPGSGAATVPDRVVAPTQQAPAPPLQPSAPTQQAAVAAMPQSQVAGMDLAPTHQHPGDWPPPGPPPGPSGPPGPVGPPLGTAPPQPAPPRRRRGLMFGLLAAIVVLVIGAVVAAAYFLWPGQGTAPAPSQSSSKPPASQGQQQSGQPAQPPPAKAQIVLPFKGFKHLQGVAVDDSGTVYVTVNDDEFGQPQNARVLRLEQGSDTPNPLPFDELTSPYGVAVNSGNIYVTDLLHGGRVAELRAGTPSPVDLLDENIMDWHRLSQPSGVAVDNVGDVFIADTNHDSVVRIPAGGRALVVVSSHLNRPTGLAVDVSNRVYVVDSGNNRVVRLTPGPRGSDEFPLPFSDLNQPSGVAVDKDGNVYVANAGNSRVLKLAAGSNTQTVLQFAGLSRPVGVAVDKDGNVYVADDGTGQVVKLPKA
jgi:serine/threonine protein phosphatase PrpC/sugar lactone lactonase YvrE